MIRSVFNIVEGGLDLFSIDEFVSVQEISADITSLSALQNPFRDQTTIRISGSAHSNGQLLLYNAEGQLADIVPVSTSQTEVTCGKQLSPGLYLVRYVNEQGATRSLKIVKQ